MRMFLGTSKKVAFRIALSMVALVFLSMGMLFGVACFNRILVDLFEHSFLRISYYFIDTNRRK